MPNLKTRPVNKIKPPEGFGESVKDCFHSMFQECWDEIIQELRSDVYASFGGYEKAELSVIDGCAGQTWWENDVSKLVTEFMKERDGSSGEPEESGWCDNLAADLEVQAARLRKHAKKLRSRK